MPSEPPPRPRPILLKLASSWDRRLIMSEVHNLKDFKLKGVFIREDLSPEARLKRRELYLARKEASNAGHSPSASSATPAQLDCPSSVNSTESSGAGDEQ